MNWLDRGSHQAALGITGGGPHRGLPQGAPDVIRLAAGVSNEAWLGVIDASATIGYTFPFGRTVGINTSRFSPYIGVGTVRISADPKLDEDEEADLGIRPVNGFSGKSDHFAEGFQPFVADLGFRVITGDFQLTRGSVAPMPSRDLVLSASNTKARARPRLAWLAIRLRKRASSSTRRSDPICGPSSARRVTAASASSTAIRPPMPTDDRERRAPPNGPGGQVTSESLGDGATRSTPSRAVRREAGPGRGLANEQWLPARHGTALLVDGSSMSLPRTSAILSGVAGTGCAGRNRRAAHAVIPTRTRRSRSRSGRRGLRPPSQPARPSISTILDAWPPEDTSFMVVVSPPVAGSYARPPGCSSSPIARCGSRTDSGSTSARCARASSSGTHGIAIHSRAFVATALSDAAPRAGPAPARLGLLSSTISSTPGSRCRFRGSSTRPTRRIRSRTISPSSSDRSSNLRARSCA